MVEPIRPMKGLRRVARYAALAALVAISGAQAARAEETTEGALTVAGFAAAPGDKALVTTRRMKKRPQTEKLGLEIVSVTTYEVEVLEAIEDGYVIRWSPIDSRVEGAPPELEKRLMESLGDSIAAFEFESDIRGAPLRIRNRDAVEERLFQAIGSLEGDQANQARQAARKMMESMSDEAFATILAKDAALLAATQHPDARPAGEETVASVRPNPFGGEPVEASTTVEIAPSDHDGLARYNWTVDVDEAAVKDSIAAVLRKMAEGAGRPAAEVDAQVAAIELTFEERGQALIGIDDGWARAVTFERKLEGGLPGDMRNQSERIEIALTRAGDGRAEGAAEDGGADADGAEGEGAKQ